jgi:hypothetical protein
MTCNIFCPGMGFFAFSRRFPLREKIDECRRELPTPWRDLRVQHCIPVYLRVQICMFAKARPRRHSHDYIFEIFFMKLLDEVGTQCYLGHTVYTCMLIAHPSTSFLLRNITRSLIGWIRPPPPPEDIRCQFSLHCKC